MPAVLRVDGFRFMIFQGSAEHGPPHVHAIKAGAEIVINLSPIGVREIKEMTIADARAAVRIAEEHHEVLLDAWKRING